MPALPAHALSADLNEDGVVDFDDFFLFAEQFGRTGDPDVPDTVVVIRTDTLQIVVRDTLVVADTLVVLDTLTVIDTVYIDPADTITRTGTAITFADPALEFAIRAKVGVPEGDLLTGDVAGITTLNLTGQSISLIDGLQNFTSLETLSLTNNLVVDVSPLQGLTALRTLTLAHNDVRDIAPLANNLSLASGSSVILAGNPLSVASRTTHVHALQERNATVTADAFIVTFGDSLLELAVRAALVQPEGDLLHLDLETVSTLDVAADSISDLSGIEFMRGLIDLDLRDNQITSISQLSSLKKLEVLDLSHDPIGSFSPLAGLTALRDLRLTGTGMASVSPLADLTSLQVLYLDQNSLDSSSELSSLTYLRQLNLRSNSIADLTAMLGMSSLTDAWLESNPLNSHAHNTVILTLVDQGAFVRF